MASSRWLDAKYGGACAACGAAIATGQRAYWERPTHTLYCEPCGVAREQRPVDPEEVRAYRQAKLDARIDRQLAKADRLEQAGQARTAELERQDWAWATQPTDRSTSGGRAFANSRNRIRARADQGMRLQLEAHELREQAAWSERRGARVAGDAERAYQAQREALDARLGVGSRVTSAMYQAAGTIVRVYAKSYRVRWDGEPGDPTRIAGREFSIDKTYVRPAD